MTKHTCCLQQCPAQSFLLSLQSHLCPVEGWAMGAGVRWQWPQQSQGQSSIMGRAALGCQRLLKVEGQ